jgi:hypothetical protein
MMNKLLTRKKHSKRLAKILLKQGEISREYYDNLYIEYYKEYKRPKRKTRWGCRFTRYYPELFHCTFDYWGEADETSIIDFTEEKIYWETVNIDGKGRVIKQGKSFKNTKDLIKYVLKES